MNADGIPTFDFVAFPSEFIPSLHAALYERTFTGEKYGMHYCVTEGASRQTERHLFSIETPLYQAVTGERGKQLPPGLLTTFVDHGNSFRLRYDNDGAVLDFWNFAVEEHRQSMRLHIPTFNHVAYKALPEQLDALLVKSKPLHR